jgi:hypothetical protein
MVEDGIIETAKSPYINPLTIVPRPGKAPRICVDARKVNECTVADGERTQPIPELLQRFNRVKFLSSLDLTSAFLQIPLTERCRKYIAFLFDSTQYQFTRVPYGFRNSQSALIRALKMVFGPEADSYLIAYVDDLVVFSKSYDEHLYHLRMVLDKLTSAGLTINLEKCKFYQTRIRFLGHVIDQDGVSPDPDRIAAVLTYPVPHNQKQLRKFLGTCNYHHRFIINYAQCVAPLLTLLKKGSRWKWIDEMQRAFESIRQKFAASIHLVHPNETQPFSIYTDASRIAIGGVLMQADEEGNPQIISTTSRVLTAYEQHYTTCEQELLSIVNALQKFRIYVFGRKIRVHTDNKALSFLKRCVLTSNRVARWVMQLQEYELDISHIRGAENHLADVLSRNPSGLSPQQINDLTKPRELLVAALNLDIDDSVKRQLKDLLRHQTQDPTVEAIRQQLANESLGVKSKYRLHNRIVYVNCGTPPGWRAYLPAHLERPVIKFIHTSYGHSGTDKCVSIIADSFYVKNLGRKVRQLLASCEVCQLVKQPNRSYDIEFTSHCPRKPGELLSVDLYGPIPTGRAGAKFIFVCVDVFSKHAKLYPLRSATAKACLNKIVKHYRPNVIHPGSILSDHGTQFTSPVWRKSLGDLNIIVKYSPIRHPESNPSERFMRELGKFFKIYCSRSQKRWPELIPHIEEWLNSTVSASTGFVPVQLMFGAPRPNPFEKLIPTSPEGSPAGESLEEMITKAYAKIRKRASDRERKRKKGKFNWEPQLGDKVLVRNQPHSNAARGIAAKFQHPFTGPFSITNIIPPSIYEVSDHHGKVRGIFNKRDLKAFRSEPDAG